MFFNLGAKYQESLLLELRTNFSFAFAMKFAMVKQKNIFSLDPEKKS